MDNFDKLIKEKIEKEEHSFKEAYWNSFAQKSGFHSFWTGSKIALVSIAGTCFIGGGIGLAVLLSKSNSTPVETLPQTPIHEVVVLQEEDTISEIVIAEEEVVTEYIVVPEKTTNNITPTANKNTKQASEVQEAIAPVIDSTSALPVTRVKKEEGAEKENDFNGWRIICINPDTISSNY